MGLGILSIKEIWLIPQLVSLLIPKFAQVRVGNSSELRNHHTSSSVSMLAR